MESGVNVVPMQAALLMVLLLASWKRREGRLLGSSLALQHH